MPITGASSGIGAELSYIFAEKDDDLILVGRDEERLTAMQDNVKAKSGKLPTTSRRTCLYLTLPSSFTITSQRRGLRWMSWVNIAGLGGAGDTFEQPIELAERMMTLNCISLVQLTQLFGRDGQKGPLRDATVIKRRW